MGIGIIQKSTESLRFALAGIERDIEKYKETTGKVEAVSSAVTVTKKAVEATTGLPSAISVPNVQATQAAASNVLGASIAARIKTHVSGIETAQTIQQAEVYARRGEAPTAVQEKLQEIPTNIALLQQQEISREVEPIFEQVAFKGISEAAAPSIPFTNGVSLPEISLPGIDLGDLGKYALIAIAVIAGAIIIGGRK